MTKLYITHITIHNCHSYVVENNKQSINEWYQEHIGQNISDALWSDICEICPTGCSRDDEANNVSIRRITFNSDRCC